MPIDTSYEVVNEGVKTVFDYAENYYVEYDFGRLLSSFLVLLTLSTFTLDTVFTLLNKAGQTKLKKGLLHV